MTRLITILLLGLLATPGLVQADTFGFHLGGGYWLADFDGDVIAGVDVDAELDLEDTGATYIYAHLEHPIPLIPNLRVARTQIDESGTGTLATNFSFEGVNFTAGQLVETDIDLSHTDFTLYYEVVDLGMDLDLGLTARYLEGEVSLGTTDEAAEVLLPMLYVRGKFNLPFTGTYLGGQINGASFSGDRILDADVKIGWQTENFIFPEFGIEAGYRQFTLDVDESVLIDMDVRGAFVNLTAHF